MANNDYAFFYDSENGDRVYNADSFSDWLKKFFTTGVFKDDLFVSATTGMVVSVGQGYANVNGKVRLFDTETSFTIDAANAQYPRIDTIVVERNDADRNITLKYVKGQLSGNTPQPTAPVRENEVYQLVLAQVYVGAGVTSIAQANITDKRPDDTVCGYVTGTVEEIDFDHVTAQFEDYFAAWFEEFKGKVEQDDAMRLQLEIDENQTFRYETVVDNPVADSTRFTGGYKQEWTIENVTADSVPDYAIADKDYIGGIWIVTGNRTYTVYFEDMPSTNMPITLIWRKSVVYSG